MFAIIQSIREHLVNDTSLKKYVYLVQINKTGVQWVI